MREIELGGGLTWREMTTSDGAEFWSVLGPMATDKAVVKELSGPVTCTDRHIWLFGSDAKGTAAMACLVLPKGPGEPGWIDSAWVRPDIRRQGLWSRMAKYRIAAAKGFGVARLRVCTITQADALGRMGFSTYQQRGRWHYMERAIGKKESV